VAEVEAVWASFNVVMVNSRYKSASKRL